MNKTIQYHLFTTLLLSLVIYIFDTKQNSLSFLVGSSLIFFNFLILFWVWQKIISKKLVALAVSVIVIKYAIFGVIIYLVLKNPNIQPIWFSAGIGTIVITSLLTALEYSQADSKD